MKSCTITNKILLLLCIFTLGVFSSCSDNDDEETTEQSGTKAINFIKKYLYNSDGSVKAGILDNYQQGEYAVITENGEGPCAFFTQITGIEAPLKGSYEYKFNATQEPSCKITIIGKSEAVNGEYATLYFDIPSCEEIKIMHIGTLNFFEGTNDSEKKKTYKIPIMETTSKE